MELRVIGCHGGETPKHRTSAFVLGGKLAIDAGSLTSEMDLAAQCALEAVLVSHAHLDHVRDLATIADNRAQQGCPPLVLAGTKPTLGVLKKHFFNNLLWPDFARIPSASKPTIRYLEMKLEAKTKIAGFTARAIAVSHTIDSNAFLVEWPGGSIAYSGDTGPTDRLWTFLNEAPPVQAMLMEVSFPDEQQRLARVSGHHTPKTLAIDLKKLARIEETPIVLYHIKPSFQAQVERECAKIKGANLTIARLGERYIF